MPVWVGLQVTVEREGLRVLLPDVVVVAETDQVPECLAVVVEPRHLLALRRQKSPALLSVT